MLKSNTLTLDTSDILALLREFNSEAENVIAHLEEIQRACRSQIAQFAHDE